MKHRLLRIYLSKIKDYKIFSYANYSRHAEFSKILMGAEQTVGYNTSYLSLKNLFNDDISTIALNLKSIIDRKHPLLKATKDMIYGDHNIVQLHGLILLLIAKLFGFPATFKSYTPAEIDQGITLKQRTLSEITQLIYMAKLIQRGITEYSACKTVNKSTTGNNLAVLSGDYLLAQACTDLATIEDPPVVEQMSQAIADQMILEYNNYDYQANQQFDMSLPQKHSYTKPLNNYPVYNLLAYSSLSILKLVKHHEDQYEVAFNFGDNIGQALEILSDMNLKNADDNYLNLNKNYNYENCSEKLYASLDILAKFHECDAKMFLENIIKSFIYLLTQSKCNSFTE